MSLAAKWEDEKCEVKWVVVRGGVLTEVPSFHRISRRQEGLRVLLLLHHLAVALEPRMVVCNNAEQLDGQHYG